MAFVEHMNSANIVEPWMLVAATADEAYLPGEALKYSANGTVTKATGTELPEFICQERVEKAVEGQTISVTLTHAQQRLEVPLEAEGSALKPGMRVTIGSDGLTVTATEGDVFMITDVLGTAVGDKVRGYFLR